MLKKMMLVIMVLVFSAAFYAVYTGTSISEIWGSLIKEDPPSCAENNSLCEEFMQIAPLPVWWYEVGVSGVEISNYDELISHWQSEKRCCSEQEIKTTNRQFFKAMYLQLVSRTDDPDIVVNAINLMKLSYLDYPYFYPLTMFALNHYPDYKKPLHGCANCKTGDTLASLLEDLRNLMAQEGLYQEYIDLTEGFLLKRGIEMSDYYEARVYFALARSYKDARQTPEAIRILSSMPERYGQSTSRGSLLSTLRSAEIMLKDITNTINQQKDTVPGQ